MIYIVTPDNNVLRNCLHDLGSLNPFKKWQIEVKEYNPKRSLNQNALLWKWYGIIGKEIGYTPEQLHDACKSKFLGRESKTTVFGEEYETLKSTAELNKKDFSDYMVKIEALAMQYDIKLPSPDYYGLETK